MNPLSYDLDKRRGLEMAARLIQVANNLRALLNLIKETPKRASIEERPDTKPDSANEGRGCENKESCPPLTSTEPEGVLESACAYSGQECQEQGCRRNPLSATFNPLQVLLQAEFQLVLGDDDYVLSTIKMNLHALEKHQTEGLGELSLGRSSEGIIHCSLLSSPRSR